MKRFFVVLMVILTMLVVVSCGNKQIFDTNYTFKRAIILLANGEVVDGNVESWKDFEDGDQIQVKVNGTTYLVHSSNITLIT